MWLTVWLTMIAKKKSWASRPADWCAAGEWMQTSADEFELMLVSVTNGNGSCSLSEWHEKLKNWGKFIKWSAWILMGAQTDAQWQMNERTSFNSLNNVEANLFIMLTCGDESFFPLLAFSSYLLFVMMAVASWITFNNLCVTSCEHHRVECLSSGCETDLQAGQKKSEVSGFFQSLMFLLSCPTFVIYFSGSSPVVTNDPWFCFDDRLIELEWHHHRPVLIDTNWCIAISMIFNLFGHSTPIIWFPPPIDARHPSKIMILVVNNAPSCRPCARPITNYTIVTFISTSWQS